MSLGSAITLGYQWAKPSPLLTTVRLKTVGPSGKPQVKPQPSQTNIEVEATAQFDKPDAGTDPKSALTTAAKEWDGITDKLGKDKQKVAYQAFLKLLMTSSVYRQESRSPEQRARSALATKIDPDDRLLWRMPLRRLESEVVRDAMLTVSGKLDRTAGGAPCA